MMPDEQNRNVEERERPFPWHCPQCWRPEVRLARVPYRCERTYEDEIHAVDLPDLEVPRCGNCGRLVFTYAQDDAINHALRQQLRLLQPADIQAGRKKLGLNEKELATRLGVPADQVGRWENELEIQPRVVDNLLRVFFGSSEARSILAETAAVAAASSPAVSPGA